MSYARLCFLVCIFIALAACGTLDKEKRAAGRGEPAISGSPFVTVAGNQLLRRGSPYYFVGANFWYGAYLGSTDEGRRRLQKELDQLKSLGIDNLRVLAASEQTELSMAVSPALHLTPGQYNEALLIGLDVLLAEMAKRDMVAVLYFTNFWQWSGGMSQYMAWLTGEPPLDPDVTNDWSGFMQNSAKFYRSREAQEWYQQLIRTIVTRTNSITGVPYVDDPTIMAWQLANEPRPGSDEGGRPFYPHYKEWIQQTAQFIKSLDANHLVSSGSEGSMGTLRDLDLFRDAHDVPEIDYLTFHLWPKNWGWFDVKKAEQTYPQTAANSKAYILQHLQVAKELGKPIVLEEFGIERDGGDYRATAGTGQRDRFFRELFGFVETQVKIGSALVGTNFWSWGGLGIAQSADFVWRPGDPFTGDPPQEPQGLNSVFSRDASTLEVAREHAKFMKSR
ncbi:mannanase [Saccharophagus sp. K07]|uniref:glycoside hydrolase 5 family protein n=1 Tax=Saccharophagus sp. K07 TaxID=2283636 RepID=UPI001652060E|nr:cellulase family glycosylhydrolase [Saccharophagus sp. K07]MBC6904773.1 mannanase [Saccharophagus sp. K07]